MHTYEFIFKCKRCEKEVWEHVTSPDILTRLGRNWMGWSSNLPAQTLVADGSANEPAWKQKK
jgi:hypothetical protein